MTWGVDSPGRWTDFFNLCLKKPCNLLEISVLTLIKGMVVSILGRRGKPTFNLTSGPTDIALH